MVFEKLIRDYDDSKIEEALLPTTPSLSIGSGVTLVQPKDENDTTHGYNLPTAIIWVSSILRTNRIRLSRWVNYYFENEEIPPLKV